MAPPSGWRAPRTGGRPGSVGRGRYVTVRPTAMFLAVFTSAWSVCPQARQRKTAWLSRLSAAAWTDRFSPALARTFTPGASTVPRADRTMFSTPVRSALRPRRPAPQALQPCGLTLAQARHVQQRRQPGEVFPGLGQLTGLLAIARRARPPRPPMLMPLNSQVPHISGVRAVLQQHRLLGGCGHKPKPHARTLITTTDIPRRERRFLPGPKAGVSTPHNR
jgi:hypothetical protein